MPTPMRVRGKRGNQKHIRATKVKQSNVHSAIPPLYVKRYSQLESLPNELLQEILLLSLNLDFALTSPPLALALNNHTLKRRLLLLAFGKFHRNYLTVNSALDPEAKLELQNSIIRRKWFNSELFFSCQQEFFTKQAPGTLAVLTADSRHNDVSWQTIVDEHINRRREEWYIINGVSRSLGRVRAKGSMSAIWPWFNKIDNSNPVTTNDHKHEIRAYIHFVPFGNEIQFLRWTLFDNEENSDGANSAVTFTANLGTIQQWPPRVVNPEQWSQQHLALILAFRRRLEGFSTFTPESKQALSDGLMTAINQKFIPAIYVLAKPFFTYIMAGDPRQQRCEEWLIRGLDVARSSQANTRNHEWLQRWQHHLTCIPRLRQDHGCLTAESAPAATGDVMLPTTGEHLVQMARIVTSEKDEDLELVQAFQWLSISFIISILNKKTRRFPEDTVRQIHALSLQDDHGLRNGEQCYVFLKEALDDLWTKKSRA